MHALSVQALVLAMTGEGAWECSCGKYNQTSARACSKCLKRRERNPQPSIRPLCCVGCQDAWQGSAVFNDDCEPCQFRKRFWSGDGSFGGLGKTPDETRVLNQDTGLKHYWGPLECDVCKEASNRPTVFYEKRATHEDDGGVKSHYSKAGDRRKIGWATPEATDTNKKGWSRKMVKGRDRP